MGVAQIGSFYLGLRVFTHETNILLLIVHLKLVMMAWKPSFEHVKLDCFMAKKKRVSIEKIMYDGVTNSQNMKWADSSYLHNMVRILTKFLVWLHAPTNGLTENCVYTYHCFELSVMNAYFWDDFLLLRQGLPVTTNQQFLEFSGSCKGFHPSILQWSTIRPPINLVCKKDSTMPMYTLALHCRYFDNP